MCKNSASGIYVTNKFLTETVPTTHAHYEYSPMTIYQKLTKAF